MPKPPQPQLTAKASALAVLSLGLALTVWVSGLLWKGNHRAWEEEVRRLGQDRAELLRGQVLRSMEVLHAMVACMWPGWEVTRTEFRDFVNEALARQPELQALAWDPRVAGGDREAWEARARREGFPNFHFTEEKSEGTWARPSLGTSTFRYSIWRACNATLRHWVSMWGPNPPAGRHWSRRGTPAPRLLRPHPPRTGDGISAGFSRL